MYVDLFHANLNEKLRLFIFYLWVKLLFFLLRGVPYLKLRGEIYKIKLLKSKNDIFKLFFYFRIGFLSTLL